MATGVGSGLSSTFGIATETTPQTPVAVSRFVEFDSDTLQMKRNTAVGQGLRGSGASARRAVRRVLVSRMAGGDVPFDIPSNGLGVYLQHMLGSFSTAATQIASSTAWQQIHNVGSTQGKTFTAQKVAPDTTGYLHPFTYPGSKITDWEVTAAQSAIAKLKLTIDAADEVTESQVLTPTTLSSSCIAGATSISTVATIPAGTYIGIDVGGLVEYVTTGTPTGAGPFTIPITLPATGLVRGHASGVQVGSGQSVYSSVVKQQTAVYGAGTGLFSFKDADLVFGGTTSVASGVWTNTNGLALNAANGVVVRNVSLKGSRPMKTDRVGAGAVLKAEQLENNFLDITGSLDIEYWSRAAYDAYQTDQTFALVLTFQNQEAGNIGTSGKLQTLQFYMPACKFDDGVSPQVSGPDVLLQKAPFTALDDGTNGVIQAYYISTDTTV